MEVVQSLLERGVPTRDGRSCVDVALRYAAFNGPAGVVTRLLEFGAHPAKRHGNPAR